MNTIINTLSADQIEFIINLYGTVESWFAHYGSAAQIVMEDIIL